MLDHTDKLIGMSLDAAGRQVTAGEKTAAFSDYSRALILTLHNACCIPLHEGISLLRGSQAKEIIHNLRTLFDALGHDIGKRTYGPGFRSSIGLVDLLTVAHALWLIEEYSFGESLIQAATQPPFSDESGKFWGEYVNGFVAFIAKSPWEPRLPKVSGIQKHWAGCLTLISDITNGRPITDSLSAVQESFARCNKDKRIHVPGLRPDPSGEISLNWDFRLEAIRSYCLHRYDLRF